MRPFHRRCEKKNEIVGSGGGDGGTSVMYLRPLWRCVGLGCDEGFRLHVWIIFRNVIPLVRRSVDVVVATS